MRRAAHNSPAPAPAPARSPPGLQWRSWLASLLKLLLFIQSLCAVSILICGLWLFSIWRQSGLPLDIQGLPAPWFVCALVGVGILVFVVAFTGHIATDASNTGFLCLYVVLIFTLIVLEGALIGELVLNKHLEKDLPNDSTGELKKFSAFVKNNKAICELVIASFVGVQVMSLLVAVVLMVHSRRVDYESEENFVAIRRPLLHSQGAPGHASMRFDNTLSSRMRQKNELESGIAHTQHSRQTDRRHQHP